MAARRHAIFRNFLLRVLYSHILAKTYFGLGMEAYWQLSAIPSRMLPIIFPLIINI